MEKGEEGKTKVQFEEQDFGNDIGGKDVEEVSKRTTRSITDAIRQEKGKKKYQLFGFRWKILNVLMT